MTKITVDDLKRTYLEYVNGGYNDIGKLNLVAYLGEHSNVLFREIERLRAVIERIAAGNPAKPGEWLTDIEMADIARAALKRE